MYTMPQENATIEWGDTNKHERENFFSEQWPDPFDLDGTGSNYAVNNEWSNYIEYIEYIEMSF